MTRDCALEVRQILSNYEVDPRQGAGRIRPGTKSLVSDSEEEEEEEDANGQTTEEDEDETMEADEAMEACDEVDGDDGYGGVDGGEETLAINQDAARHETREDAGVEAEERATATNTTAANQAAALHDEIGGGGAGSATTAARDGSPAHTDLETPATKQASAMPGRNVLSVLFLM